MRLGHMLTLRSLSPILILLSATPSFNTEMPVRDGPEVEIKLEVADAEAVLDGLLHRRSFDIGSRVNLTYVGERLTRDVYFDTPNQELLRAGWVLRVRAAYDGRVSLQAKRPGLWSRAALERDEVAHGVDPRERRALEEGRGLESAPATRAVVRGIPGLRPETLVPALRVVDLRNTFFVGPPKEPRRFLMTLDVGTFETPDGTQRVEFSELEIELIGHDTEEARDQLHRLGEVVSASFELRRSSASKYARGAQALAEERGR